ncbi:hypothetical protein [Spirosoma agri]|uniref:Uncharacterized protein n=1 Tax=Spirosoma agri TaxID=1987381 RepID=A0A6M0IIJ3_9BACT|nr:hypothetical protein [Spirosoma agri]NEU68069.1 hypothetical protein [Spirosoma agri]
MELEEINVAHNKWVIGFRLEGAQLYSVWGADSTDSGNDKLWIDEYQNIITFGTFQQPIEAVLTSSLPLFDSDNVHRWASLIMEHGHSNKPTSVYIYDIDRISKQIDQIDFDNLEANSPDLMHELITILNLVGDYVLQIDDKAAMKTWGNSSLRLFQEYMYNAYFWTIPPEELKHKQAELLRNYNAFDCEQSLTKTLLIFRERLQV